MFKTENIGKAYVTNSELVYFEKRYRENLNIEDYVMIKGSGCMFNGQAGSGKTTKLFKMVLKEANPIAIQFYT